MPVDEITQDVHLALGHISGEFDAGDDFKRGAARGLLRGIDARDRIVIGEGERRQAALERKAHEFDRGQLAVRCIGMSVQINAEN